MSLRVGGLFAGVGGIELGLSQVLDCHPAWWSEVDPAPSRVLAHRWPDVPNLGDITRIDWTKVEPVDVITGGSPCQDLSHAGKRLGMKPGTRSGLWAAMCDAIDILRPALVVWENVRGALSAEAVGAVEPCPICVGDEREPHLRALGRVLGDLAELGYDAAWCGLRAADVGAPHGRFRVFVLAWPAADTDVSERSGRGGPRGVGGGASGPGGEGVQREWQGDSALGGSATPQDADRPAGGERRLAAPGQAPGGRSRADACGSDRAHPSSPIALLLPTPRATRGGSATETVALLPTPAVNDMGDRPWAAEPGAWEEWVARHKARGINGNGHGPSLAVEALRSGESWGPYAPAVRRWERVLGRSAPPPTEPTGKDGAPRLSARAVEFLMGLPDGWVTDVPGVTRNHALKALGNGCVPQQVAAAVTHLLAVRRTHALVA